MVAASSLLGVVLLARHGDRLEFFQDPLTYDPTQTFLTPLGSVGVSYPRRLFAANAMHLHDRPKSYSSAHFCAPRTWTLLRPRSSTASAQM